MTDINECLTAAGICGEADCLNTKGSYTCICPDGYATNDGGTGCQGTATHRPDSGYSGEKLLFVSALRSWVRQKRGKSVEGTDRVVSTLPLGAEVGPGTLGPGCTVQPSCLVSPASLVNRLGSLHLSQTSSIFFQPHPAAHRSRATGGEQLGLSLGPSTLF